MKIKLEITLLANCRNQASFVNAKGTEVHLERFDERIEWESS